LAGRRVPGTCLLSASPKDVCVLIGDDGVERQQRRALGGALAAFTQRAPGKASSNEDTAGWCLKGDALLLVVADGAGGMPRGSEASQLAVRTLLDFIAAAAGPLIDSVITGIAAANRKVMFDLPGSATTMSLALIENGLLRTLQVGDSETLLFGQRGRLRFITTPHSPIGYAVEAGDIDERLALFHPDRHYVSNFVGTPGMSVEVSDPIKLNTFDTVVVASDGLTDNLFRDEIVDASRTGALDDAVDHLVRLAQLRMVDQYSGLPSKPDDLSIVAFRPRVVKNTRRRKRR